MKNKVVIVILTLGVFSIINTEMGIVGILPLISTQYQVSISQAGWMVSLFALVVAFAGPTMPLISSGMNRKHAMLMVLGVFTICNLIAAFASSFSLALLVRVIPAFFQPIYISLAFTVAADAVKVEEAPKAVAKVMMGVSAGMVVGVPVVSYLAQRTSLTIAMLFFAIINLICFVATMMLVPSQQSAKKQSYNTQLQVLKQPLTWISILGVICLNGAIFGVYSYLSEYLAMVTHIDEEMVSMLLLLYGGANLIGNMIGGKALSDHPLRFVMLFPFLLGILYIVLFLLGAFTIPTTMMILLWGVLAGAAGNINQYWITSVTIEAKEFGNGLFLAATNLGTTIGTTLCGWYISSMGISYVVWGGAMLLIGGIIFILYRVYWQTHKVLQRGML